jgi:excisionase family DNA binding protein
MTLTVRKIQERFGVGESTVLAWIRSGELRAFDVSRNRGKRPSWRITEEALAAFELARSSAAPPPPRTRRKKQAAVIDFY